MHITHRCIPTGIYACILPQALEISWKTKTFKISSINSPLQQLLIKLTAAFAALNILHLKQLKTFENPINNLIAVTVIPFSQFHPNIWVFFGVTSVLVDFNI